MRFRSRIVWKLSSVFILVLLVVIGTIFERVEMFVDFALAYAMLNFLGSLAASRYLHKIPSQARGPATEPDSGSPSRPS